MMFHSQLFLLRCTSTARSSGVCKPPQSCFREQTLRTVWVKLGTLLCPPLSRAASDMVISIRNKEELPISLITLRWLCEWQRPIWPNLRVYFRHFKHSSLYIHWEIISLLSLFGCPKKSHFLPIPPGLLLWVRRMILRDAFISKHLWWSVSATEWLLRTDRCRYRPCCSLDFAWWVWRYATTFVSLYKSNSPSTMASWFLPFAVWYAHWP